MPLRPSRATVTTIAVASVAALALPTGLVATAEVDTTPAPQPVSAPAAEHALAVAEAVMAGESDVMSPTLALRDLALRAEQLTGADRATAEALLARPNQIHGGSGDGFAAWTHREAIPSRNDQGCSADPQTPICVHWTNGGGDAPNRQDSDNDNVPNWVETTLREMETVWSFEVDNLGFREPLADDRGSKDAGGAFDVYLSNIGSRYYGYCAVDDTRTQSTYDFKDRSGYCVLDDDYARTQFPAHTPLENLQVTAAHEFFHAIQFAYDASEDLWFMEGGAAWIEDEVYTDVNDNRQYLATSQFRHPRRPLDNNRGIGVYGTWGFLRYLSEDLGTDVIKRAWQRADGAPGGPDDYSLVALRKAIKTEGGVLTNKLATFGVAVSEPEAFLNEGDRFPSSSVDTFTLDRRRSTTRWRNYTLDHLSFAPVTLRPGNRLRASDRLHISVDAPRRNQHPEARVMVVHTDGSYGSVQTIRLNRKGRGSTSTNFGGSNVKRVVLAMANTSTDFRRCFSHLTAYSCKGGIPVDENQRHWFKAVVS